MMLRSAIKALARSSAFQRAWDRLYRIALSGMNIGVDGAIATSGERWVMDLVAQHLEATDAGVVFDVGANTGEYTFELITRLGGGVRIYCFEPSRDTFAALVQRFRGSPEVECCNFGLSDREGVSVIYAYPEESGLTSLYRRGLQHLGKEFHPQEQVSLRRLDEFCRERGIGHVHLLKLDVEGHELSVLRGADRLLDTNAIDFIQFEFGGCNIDSRTYFRDFFHLLNPRYRLHRILRHGLAPIEAYRESAEVFVTTNFLAVSRTLSGAPALTGGRP